MATITGIVFPAHAGMSRRGVSSGDALKSFPRTRGDEPAFSVYRYQAVAFSPHTRG